MADPPRPLCAEVSRADAEPLAATASRVERWLLVEYRGLWAHDALGGSALDGEVKAALRAWADAEPRSRVLFVRRPERRGSGQGVVAFVARTTQAFASLRRLELASHDEVGAAALGDDVGEPVAGPLFLVCTHGKHDRCCAKFGRPVYDALAEALEEEQVWQCSHIGGDRFAGNVLVLPEGLYLGRVDPDGAWSVADDVLAGRIPLAHYRGRSCDSFPAQAGERAVREATGLLGLREVRLAGVEPDGAGWRVRCATAAGDLWEVEVERRHGALTHLTCSAEELRHPRHYVAGGPVRVA